MKNVLLIAPDLGLEKAADEVRAVSISLNALPLIGRVSRGDVLGAMGTRQWDIIWFATHGNDEGVALSDGPLATGDLAAIVRNTSASLVVLNTCSSRHIGLELHSELGVDVICTQTDANDITAYQTGTLLARNIASGMSVRQAFERSKPGNNLLYFLFEDKGKRAAEEKRGNEEIIEILYGEFAKMYHALDDLKRDMSRRMDKMQEDMDEKMSLMAEKFGGVDRRVLVMETIFSRSSPVDRWVAFMFLSVMLIMFIVYLWNSLN